MNTRPLTPRDVSPRAARSQLTPARKRPRRKRPASRWAALWQRILPRLKRLARGMAALPRLLLRWMFSRRMLAFGGSLVLTGMLVAIIGMIYYASLLPDISGLAVAKEQPGIEMLGADGQAFARYGQVAGKYIPYHQLPPHLIDAVIATEDRRFFSHWGVDLRGIARAMVVNLRAGRFVQGGSTITQQLAKNVFLSSERTMSRKIQELMMAIWLEQTFTKEEILSIYLNRVYMGGGSYGVDSAAHYYFDKPVAELDLVECAMLAGLLKAPSRYNPTANNTLALQRARQVIANMLAAEKITAPEAAQAQTKLASGKQYLRKRAVDNQRYFADWIAEQLPSYIGELKEDVIVRTTLDASAQSAAEEVVAAQFGAEVRAQAKAGELALLAMRPDGAVVAMMGGRDYNTSQYNRAIQSRRQPGSAFKMFVYLAAMEHGYRPDMLVSDAPVRVGKWQPENYNRRYRGTIPISEALAQSVNTVAVQLSQSVGIGTVRNAARRLGVTSPLHEQPSLALGAAEVSLKEMVSAYAHLASGGHAVRPYGITEVRRKRDGTLLYERTQRDDFSGVTVVAPDAVAKMNTLLSGAIREGTARAADIGRPAAGKTGTTSDYKDAWFIGYTPDLVTGVWVGNDNATPTAKITGGNLPAQLWAGFMRQALDGVPAHGLPLYDPYTSQGGALPWQDGRPQPQQPQPRGGDGGFRLEPSFWDTLFDDGRVEYDYPNAR